MSDLKSHKCKVLEDMPVGISEMSRAYGCGAQFLATPS